MGKFLCRKILSRILILSMLLFACPGGPGESQVLAKTKETPQLSENAIYVSRKGSDENDGSLERPYASLQKALDRVTKGQTIYVRKGTYKGFSRFVTSGDGESYITLTAYPGEKAVLKGIAKTEGAVLDLGGNSYIEISGLDIGGFKAERAYGILLDEGESHIRIKNNKIHNLATKKGEANAILCIGYEPGEEKAVRNIEIEGNSIYSNSTYWSEALSVTGNSRNVTIKGNRVYKNKNIGIDFCGNFGYCPDPFYDQPRDCIAEGNIVYSNKCSYAECAGIYVDGARNIQILNNTVYKNMYGIEVGAEEKSDYPTRDILVSGNEIYKNPYGGIRIGGYEKDTTGWVRDADICNNLLTDNGQGEGLWNGEFNLGQCSDISFCKNEIHKKNKWAPIFASDFEDGTKGYIENISLKENVLYRAKQEAVAVEGDWEDWGEVE